MPEPQFPAVAGATGAAIRHHEPQPRATRSVTVRGHTCYSTSAGVEVRATLTREPWTEKGVDK